jgi:hypothetical protein
VKELSLPKNQSFNKKSISIFFITVLLFSSKYHLTILKSKIFQLKELSLPKNQSFDKKSISIFFITVLLFSSKYQ